MTSKTEVKIYASTEGMNSVCQSALRSLLLACADTKLLLGYHYGEWTFGPPEIEAAIACCSLCQTELGHVRLLHGILNKHYSDDADELVESRKPGDFANISFLDQELQDWAELVSANYIVDLAVTSVLHSLRKSSFKPLHTSLEKMLQEERYHLHHGQGWFRTLAARSSESSAAVEKSGQRALRAVVEWFGPLDSAEDQILIEEKIKTTPNREILQMILNELGKLSASLKVDLDLTREADNNYQLRTQPDWQGWNPQTRRIDTSGPDEQILYHLRGSKNKVFKLT
ncbi:MAG: Phenylacetic acid catabolic protein [bacterium]